MMYASKIQVKKEPQLIGYKKTFTLHGLLTLDILKKYVLENESFSIYMQNGGIYPDTYTLEVYGKKLETIEEVQIRVAKAEKYNENYELFHSKYKKP